MNCHLFDSRLKHVHDVLSRFRFLKWEDLKVLFVILDINLRQNKQLFISRFTVSSHN